MNPTYYYISTTPAVPLELKKCEKCDCDRLVGPGVDFCCYGCSLAAAGGYEIHDTGLLGHSDECNARFEERKILVRL